MVVFLIIYSKMLLLQHIFKDPEILLTKITSYFSSKKQPFPNTEYEKEGEAVDCGNGRS